MSRASHSTLARAALAVVIALAGCGRATTLTEAPPVHHVPRLVTAGEHVGVYAANHRYLQTADGQPFVLIGFGNEGRDPPYVVALLNGYINYLRSYAASWIATNSANDYAFGRPWPTVNGKCDMSQWNETYWANLRDYVGHCNDAGITVGLTLWDGHSDLPGGENGAQSIWNANLNAQGVQWAYDANALAQFPNPSPNGSDAEKLVYYQRRWVDRLLSEMQAYPNVIIELDNETDQAPTAWWLWWADHVRAAGTFVVATTWQASATIPDNVFATDARLDMKSYHDRSDASLTTERYGWNKIIVADGDVTCSDLSAASARAVAWSCLLRGGNWNDFVCWGQPYPDVAKLATYGILLQFLRTRFVRPWDMAPHNALVSSGLCMARLGYFYLAYTSADVTVDLTSLNGTATWEWFDPRTGLTAQTGQVSGGGPQSFTIPGANDYVLWITANGTASVGAPH